MIAEVNPILPILFFGGLTFSPLLVAVFGLVRARYKEDRLIEQGREEEVYVHIGGEDFRRSTLSAHMLLFLFSMKNRK